MNRKEFIEQAAKAARRAYQFSQKRRMQGLDGLGDDIDADALKRGCIFEFGIRIAFEGADSEHIDGILTGMISREKDETARRLKTIQKEAVICIQKSFNSFEMFNVLFSYVNDDEKKEIKGLLEEDAFKNYFNFY